MSPQAEMILRDILALLQRWEGSQPPRCVTPAELEQPDRVAEPPDVVVREDGHVELVWGSTRMLVDRDNLKWLSNELWQAAERAAP